MSTAVNPVVQSDSLFVKMIMLSWQTQNKNVDDLLKTLPAAQWSKETAPGRNTGIYLLGHFAAINDSLFKILDLGERMHPELDAVFVESPDRSGTTMPSVEELKKCWNEINAKLTAHFNTMRPEHWFAKHTLVSEDDFKKEPHRNKLNVLLTRVVHQAYHLGQLNYLKST